MTTTDQGRALDDLMIDHGTASCTLTDTNDLLVLIDGEREVLIAPDGEVLRDGATK